MYIEQVKSTQLHFILSIERSGSTLLSIMLNMHPLILSTIEEPFVFTLYAKYKNVTNWTSETIKDYCRDFYLFSEGFLDIEFGKPEDLIKMLEEHKSSLTWDIVFKLTYYCFLPLKNKSEVTTIVDKQLIFHAFLEKAARIYPKSKFIILYRDPRDSAVIRIRKSTFERQNASFLRMAFSWNYVFGSLQSKKAKIGTDRFLEIKYEELATAPEEELKKICSFLDLPYNDVMLNYSEVAQKKMGEQLKNLNTEAKKTVEYLHEGLKQKPNTGKIGIWKESLKKEEQEMIWAICRKTAEKAGYTSEGLASFSGMTTGYNYMRFKCWLNYIFIPQIYHSSPFFLRLAAKKLKHKLLRHQNPGIN